MKNKIKTFIKKVQDKLHVCIFSKPIISMYSSFNTRNIIYECRCGKRKSYRIYRPFGEAFPIETTNFLTFKEFKEIENAIGVKK